MSNPIGMARWKNGQNSKIYLYIHICINYNFGFVGINVLISGDITMVSEHNPTILWN